MTREFTFKTWQWLVGLFLGSLLPALTSYAFLKADVYLNNERMNDNKTKIEKIEDKLDLIYGEVSIIRGKLAK